MLFSCVLVGKEVTCLAPGKKKYSYLLSTITTSEKGQPKQRTAAVAAAAVQPPLVGAFRLFKRTRRIIPIDRCC